MGVLSRFLSAAKCAGTVFVGVRLCITVIISDAGRGVGAVAIVLIGVIVGVLHLGFIAAIVVQIHVGSCGLILHNNLNIGVAIHIKRRGFTAVVHILHNIVGQIT